MSTEDQRSANWKMGLFTFLVLLASQLFLPTAVRLLGGHEGDVLRVILVIVTPILPVLYAFVVRPSITSEGRLQAGNRVLEDVDRTSLRVVPTGNMGLIGEEGVLHASSPTATIAITDHRETLETFVRTLPVEGPHAVWPRRPWWLPVVVVLLTAWCVAIPNPMLGIPAPILAVVAFMVSLGGGRGRRTPEARSTGNNAASQELLPLGPALRVAPKLLDNEDSTWMLALAAGAMPLVIPSVLAGALDRYAYQVLTMVALLLMASTWFLGHWRYLRAHLRRIRETVDDQIHPEATLDEDGHFLGTDGKRLLLPLEAPLSPTDAAWILALRLRRAAPVTTIGPVTVWTHDERHLHWSGIVENTWVPAVVGYLVFLFFAVPGGNLANAPGLLWGGFAVCLGVSALSVLGKRWMDRIRAPRGLSIVGEQATLWLGPLTHRFALHDVLTLTVTVHGVTLDLRDGRHLELLADDPVALADELRGRGLHDHTADEPSEALDHLRGITTSAVESLRKG